MLVIRSSLICERALFARRRSVRLVIASGSCLQTCSGRRNGRDHGDGCRDAESCAAGGD